MVHLYDSQGLITYAAAGEQYKVNSNQKKRKKLYQKTEKNLNEQEEKAGVNFSY